MHWNTKEYNLPHELFEEFINYLKMFQLKNLTYTAIYQHVVFLIVFVYHTKIHCLNFQYRP